MGAHQGTASDSELVREFSPSTYLIGGPDLSPLIVLPHPWLLGRHNGVKAGDVQRVVGHHERRTRRRSRGCLLTLDNLGRSPLAIEMGLDRAQGQLEERESNEVQGNVFGTCILSAHAYNLPSATASWNYERPPTNEVRQAIAP